MDLDGYITSVPDFPVPGISFKDITPLLGDPKAFRQSVDEIVAAYRGRSIDRIAAFDARGFLWAAPVAYLLDVPLVPIRKAGKLPRSTVVESYQGEYGAETVELHEDAVAAGDQVLLIDDVIATGGAMLAGCRLVEQLGGAVAGCVAVIRFRDLGATDRLARYPVTSLIDY